MKGRTGRVARVLLLACCSIEAVNAQVLTRVDLDNDSFNFWQAPRRRADREYTQATRATVLWPSNGAIARRLLGGAQQCVDMSAERDCRMVSLGLTQAIYTPSIDPNRRLATERPFAGWLGAELGVQRDQERSLMAFSLTLGVTGPASFAEQGQKAVHRLLGFKPPIGWDAQLPNEIAGMVAYSGARAVVFAGDERSGLRLFVAPVWSARLGTLFTDATAGMQVTLGLRPPTPWGTGAMRRADRWGAYLRGGVSGTAVGRNLFLDGTAFAPSAQVPKYAVIGEKQIGGGVRTPAGLLEWRLHSRGKEYPGQPKAHAYSTFAYSLR